MTTAQDIIDAAAVFGIKAKLWEKAGKCRVYAQTDRRDMSVYLELEGHSTAVEGAAMKVFCNTDQHPTWIKSQVKEYREAYVNLFNACVVSLYGSHDGDAVHVAHFGEGPILGGPDIQQMIQDARAAYAAALGDSANREV